MCGSCGGSGSTCSRCAPRSDGMEIYNQFGEKRRGAANDVDVDFAEKRFAQEFIITYNARNAIT